MLPPLIFLIVGLIGIWLGAGFVIVNAQKLAKALRIDETLIGLTILSIGTSLPEIFTHIITSIDRLKGIEASGISVGTNIGSNIIQITLIIGLVAMFATIRTTRKFLKKDYLIMLGSIFLLFLFSYGGFISRIEGVILTALYLVYLYFLSEKEEIIEKIEHPRKQKQMFLYLLFVLIGLGALLFFANLVVNNALVLTEIWNVSHTFIGTVIIGVSTALPELTTALRAILKGSTGMSLGTLVGSNITNPLFALGIGAMISGYVADKVIIFFDLPFWFFVSLLPFVFLKSKGGINRRKAIVLIACYLTYVTLKLRFFM